MISRCFRVDILVILNLRSSVSNHFLDTFLSSSSLYPQFSFTMVTLSSVVILVVHQILVIEPLSVESKE